LLLHNLVVPVRVTSIVRCITSAFVWHVLIECKTNTWVHMHHNPWSTIHIMKEAGFCEWAKPTSTTKCEFKWLLKRSQEALFKNRIKPLLSSTSFRPSYPQKESNHTSCFFLKLVIVRSLPIISIYYFLWMKKATRVLNHLILISWRFKIAQVCIHFLLLSFYTLLLRQHNNDPESLLPTGCFSSNLTFIISTVLRKLSDDGTNYRNLIN
jgi:hypothetical protein